MRKKLPVVIVTELEKIRIVGPGSGHAQNAFRLNITFEIAKGIAKMKNEEVVIAWIVGIAMVIVVVLITAACYSRDYHARQHAHWKGLYIEKHCVSYSRDEVGNRFCVCFDDEACAKQKEVKP